MNKPSDAAMRLAKHLVSMVTPKDATGYWRLVKDNERYLARELEPYTKALDEAERALGCLRITYVDMCETNFVDYNKWNTNWNGAVLEALASIAALKINEKVG